MVKMEVMYIAHTGQIGGVLHLADFLKTANPPNLTPHQYFLLYNV